MLHKVMNTVRSAIRLSQAVVRFAVYARMRTLAAARLDPRARPAPRAAPRAPARACPHPKTRGTRSSSSCASGIILRARPGPQSLTAEQLDFQAQIIDAAQHNTTTKRVSSLWVVCR